MPREMTLATRTRMRHRSGALEKRVRAVEPYHIVTDPVNTNSSARSTTTEPVPAGTAGEQGEPVASTLPVSEPQDPGEDGVITRDYVLRGTGEVDQERSNNMVLDILMRPVCSNMVAVCLVMQKLPG